MTQLNAYYPKEKLKEVRPIEVQGKGLFEKFEGKVDGAKAVIQGQDASHVVALNSTVHLEDLDSGRQLVYTLVSSNSADITKNKVSAIAPLGRAILRRKSGDVVEFNAPAGLRTLRIKQIFDRPRDEDATTLDSGETAKARKQVA
jgi:GreA/GreB family transcription elongation factor